LVNSFAEAGEYENEFKEEDLIDPSKQDEQGARDCWNDVCSIDPKLGRFKDGPEFQSFETTWVNQLTTLLSRLDTSGNNHPR
jgi:hypothetical protein